MAAVATSGSYNDLSDQPTIPPAAPVDSVAGKTGVVTLVKADITDFSDADYATAAQGGTADTALQPADIGVAVQAYDADAAKTDTAQTFTAQQTFGELKEGVFTLGTSGTIALDPANGSIQSTLLTGAPTFTNSLESGQSIVLHIEGGDTNAVTWPTMTWTTSSGNTAPTLTAKDVVVLWQLSAVLYGAYVGSYA